MDKSLTDPSLSKAQEGDVLDSVIVYEEEVYEKGYSDGYTQGMIKGQDALFKDGFNAGFYVGIKLGSLASSLFMLGLNHPGRDAFLSSKKHRENATLQSCVNLFVSLSLDNTDENALISDKLSSKYKLFLALQDKSSPQLSGNFHRKPASDF